MRRWIIASLVMAAALGILSGGRPAWSQGGTVTATLGPPLKPATQAMPLVDVLYIGGLRIQAVVTNLAAQMPGETPQAAAVRKAMAEAPAINAGINAAIAAGTLPMGTPLATIAVQPNTIVLRDRNGKPIIDPVTMMPFVRPNKSLGLSHHYCARRHPTGRSAGVQARSRGTTGDQSDRGDWRQQARVPDGRRW